MRKALGNIELLLILLGEFHAVPLPKGLRLLPKIHRHVKDTAADGTHELTLRKFLLEVKAAQHALLGCGLIVLHKV